MQYCLFLAFRMPSSAFTANRLLRSSSRRSCPITTSAFSTHDLQELMELLEAAGHHVPKDAAAADELTPFAVQLRYDDLSPTCPVDRPALRELIRNLRQFAESEIGPPPA